MSNGFYSTESTNIAAWLMSHGFELLASNRIDGKVYFFFEKSQKQLDCVKSYLNNEELRQFILRIKELKKIVKA